MNNIINFPTKSNNSFDHYRNTFGIIDKNTGFPYFDIKQCHLETYNVSAKFLIAELISNSYCLVDKKLSSMLQELTAQNQTHTKIEVIVSFQYRIMNDTSIKLFEIVRLRNPNRASKFTNNPLLQGIS